MISGVNMANGSVQGSGSPAGFVGIRGVASAAADASLRHLNRIESALAPEKVLSTQAKSLRQAVSIALLASVRATLFRALLSAAEKA